MNINMDFMFWQLCRAIQNVSCYTHCCYWNELPTIYLYSHLLFALHKRSTYIHFSTWKNLMVHLMVHIMFHMHFYIWRYFVILPNSYYLYVAKKMVNYHVKSSNIMLHAFYVWKCGEKESYLPRKRVRFLHDIPKREYPK